MYFAINAWLNKAGDYTIERINDPYIKIPTRTDTPRTGILHTTEGATVEGAQAVFRQHYAPHFLVGPDRFKKMHIYQLVPIGFIGAALRTHNNLAFVQIEVVGFSKTTLWSLEEHTLDALASLLATCSTAYGIPLTHPWKDGDFGAYGYNAHRASGKFGTVAGWFGHGDVPAPDVHWDPGAMEWSKLFAEANKKSTAV